MLTIATWRARNRRRASGAPGAAVLPRDAHAGAGGFAILMAFERYVVPAKEIVK